MRNYFIFNGIDSRDYGIWILSKNSYDTPKKNLTFISVPGRNGDIVIDNGSYSNIDISYEVRIEVEKLRLFNPNLDFAYWLDELKDLFYPLIGNYYELEDSYNPNYYRLACFTGDLSFTVKNKSLEFIDTTFSFNCKPYRYRQDGKDEIEITGSYTNAIKNPELYVSLPLIEINKGSSNTSQITINGQSYYFLFSNVEIDNVKIDSESQIVYNGTTNYYKQYIPPTQLIFPQLSAGNNLVVKSSGTGTVKIIPRWRRI